MKDSDKKYGKVTEVVPVAPIWPVSLKAESFEKGENLVVRKNESRCTCKIDEDGNTILSLCGAHQNYFDKLFDDIAKLRSKNMTEKEQQCEYKTVSFLVSALANMCAIAPNQIIDRLTGLLWDEEEARQIKVFNGEGEKL